MRSFILLILFCLVGVCLNLQAETEGASEKSVGVSAPGAEGGKSTVQAVDAETNRVVVSVPGMVCQMCVHGMRKVFKDSVQDAEADVQVDLGKKTLTLNLTAALSDAEIQKKVVQAGYKAESITRL